MQRVDKSVNNGQSQRCNKCIKTESKELKNMLENMKSDHIKTDQVKSKKEVILDSKEIALANNIKQQEFI